MSKLTGRRKAAILLVSLGPDASASVFQHLRQEEIDELTLEIASVQHVPPDSREEVLQEFYETASAQQFISEGGLEYARSVLERALGSSKAEEVMARLSGSIRVSPFEFLRRTDAAQIVNVVANEHPQTVALILAYLPPQLAAQVMSAFPPEQQSEVAMRLAVMDRTAPEVIREIERVLEKRLSSVLNQDFTSAGGIKALVDVLNSVDRSTERRILESLDEQNPELAEEVRNLMFLFEDIVTLDDRSVQLVLREVDNRQLALALKRSDDDVKEKIFHNMSERAEANVREELEYMGPVRNRQIEEAQQAIVSIIRKLEEAGQIVISRGGEDELVT
ncbi:MAG: flagellar motor switch protein FliG [Thermoleophilia bacterium]|jgi:flagellar motor switch protein FliG|nr:flagellar motor switch protein FliG [Thermoleophilia bacterium]